MINLLPEENKKELKWLYRRRLGVVLGWWVAVVALSGIVLLAGFYLVLLTRERATASIIEGIKATEAGKQLAEFQAAVKLANAAARVASANKEADISPIIVGLATKAPQGVAIQALSYDPATFKGEVVGVAASRRQLVNYIDLLRADPTIAEADSPLSSVIGDRDNQFTISFTLKHE